MLEDHQKAASFFRFSLPFTSLSLSFWLNRFDSSFCVAAAYHGFVLRNTFCFNGQCPALAHKRIKRTFPVGGLKVVSGKVLRDIVIV
jgi:hypothetical protein